MSRDVPDKPLSEISFESGRVAAMLTQAELTGCQPTSERVKRAFLHYLTWLDDAQWSDEPPRVR